MKGISEIFSTIVLTSTVIMISIIVAFYAMVHLQYSLASTEYGYAKSTVVSIANNFHSILQGNTFLARVSMSRVGIGYERNSDLKLEIYVNNILIYNDTELYNLTVTIHYPLISIPQVVYGNSSGNVKYCSFIVRDVRLIPCVVEKYQNGATMLKMDTARFYIVAYKITTDTTVKYLARIYYVRIIPIVKGSSGTITVQAHKDILEQVYYNVDDAALKLTDTSLGVSLQDISLRSYLGLSPTDQLDVVVIVKEVYVVIM